MEQFEQLLTCAICLDRYRNPKLLPCQHSFCMEPCMDGLVDYVRRQVKCPECRAEHRIPYQGVQGYPTNVTLQRFLELHIEITGEMPDPTSGQIMKRCAVCTEKSYCVHCSHCSKDVCPLCKAAHMDILRREIARINNQVRRALHRLEDMLALVEKNMTALQNNCTSVTEEADEIYRRLVKAAKDRTDFLKSEVDRYLSVELKNLTTLKDNLQQEVSNIQANCDLADRHMGTEDVEWEDIELLDTKDIFLKTVDFIRNFEAEMGDYTRRVRFTMATDPNQLVLHVSTYGDLNIAALPHQITGQQQLTPGPGLMRSKSDHRLAAQYRQQDERYGEDSGRASPGRKFGQRYQRRDRDYEYEEDPRPQRSRTRSRFLHGGENTDSDNDTGGPRVRFGADQPKERSTALDTETLSKGPLSGIGRLYDCPQVIARITEVKKPKPVEEAQPPQQVKPQPKRQPSLTQRQVSEEDEITKIKRQMKNAPGERGTPDRPGQERVSALRREEAHSPPASAPESPPPQPASAQGGSSSESSDESSQQQSSTGSRKTSVTRAPPQQQSRRSSTASDTPSTGGDSARKVSTTGAAFTTEQLKQRFQNRLDTPESAPKPFVSRFLRGGVSRPLTTTTTTTAPVSATKEEEEEEESSSSEETDSSEESSEEVAATTTGDKSDIGPLLARAAQARKSSRDETYSPTRTQPSRTTSYQHETPAAPWRTRTAANNTSTEDETPAPSRYGTTSSGFTSRFLNKSKSAAAVSPDEEDPGTSRRFASSASSSNTTSQPAGSKSRYAALKDRKARLARSKSSHSLVDDDEDDEPMTPSAYLASRYGPGTSLAKSRSSHAIKSREASPEPAASSSSSLASSSTAPGEKDGAALSSWARYLKNKYGSRNKDTMSSNSRRLSLGLPLRSDPEEETKNTQGSPTSPTQHPPFLQGFGVDTSTRSKYLKKRRQVFSLGSRGSEEGCFTWPRGVATGPGDIIAVADSSNHRVQVFDSNGKFQKEFGSYGNGEGEFDCLAGVAVNRIGQFIIADRYNHRIQVMDPAGRFLRAFGSQGTADGKFNYPWGVTTDALGFIYVCDKENHRVQVFQSDGTFVGKFGSHGRGVGQLDHPHYIAVSNTNRVLVSDSNNHRVQVFDVNGRHISTIGSEGSDDGQFKFPRGVAVDDQGYIVVGDSGNNRLQIFSPEGVFLRGFGSWGSGEGEFKGLEGIAVTSTNCILACDRENHRVQGSQNKAGEDFSTEKPYGSNCTPLQETVLRTAVLAILVIYFIYLPEQLIIL